MKDEEFVGEYRSRGSILKSYEVKLILTKRNTFNVKYQHSQKYPDIPENDLPSNESGTWKVVCDDVREKIEFGEVVKTFENHYLLFYFTNNNNGRKEFFKVKCDRFPELYFSKNYYHTKSYYRVNSAGLGDGTYVDGVPDRYWNGHTPGGFLEEYVGLWFKKY